MSDLGLSVVIATHNNAHTIERAMQSVIDAGAVCIVVDDGSEDGTQERIKANGRDVAWVQTQPCSPFAAWNEGLDYVATTYVMHLDADDWLDSVGVRKVVEDLEWQEATFGWRDIFAYGATKYWGLSNRIHVPPKCFNHKDYYTGFPSLYAMVRRTEWGLRYDNPGCWPNVVIPADYTMALKMIREGKRGLFVEAPVLNYVYKPTGLNAHQKRDPEAVLREIKKLYPECELTSL